MRIDITSFMPCQFCSADNNNTVAYCLPWRDKEGWWCCKDNQKCMKAAQNEINTVMDRRKIISISALPPSLVNRLYAVKRSNGLVTMMKPVTFLCEFCNNMDNIDRDQTGRIRLDPKDPETIYVDMYSKNGDDYNYKSVKLTSLAEHNPEIGKELSFKYPSFVSEESKILWENALLKAVETAKKNMPEESVLTEASEVYNDMDNDIHDDADDEKDNDEEDNEDDDDDEEDEDDEDEGGEDDEKEDEFPTLPILDPPPPPPPTPESSVQQNPQAPKPAPRRESYRY